MKYYYSLASILFLLQLALLTGCGNESGTTSASAMAASQQCIGCHQSNIKSVSPVTGARITDEWALSAHNNINGAGCRDCHGPAHNHPNSCGQCHGGSSAVAAQLLDPDGTGQCSKCHAAAGSVKPLPSTHTPVVTSAMQASSVIWTNMTTAGYVSAKSVGKCRNCHNPHNNSLLQQNKDWAESGHADTRAWPWIHYDFKSMNTCNRCHTATGYVKYLLTGDATAWAAANSQDKTKEVLRCDACHVDYSWQRRDARTLGVDGVKLPYGTFDSNIGAYGKIANNSTSTILRSAGDSNLCLNCHSGLVSGLSIANGTATTLLNNSFGSVNSHYFGTAGTMYGLLGYEYRPHDDYLLVSNGSVVFEHNQIGLVNITDRGHMINLGTSRGPCVGCHMDDQGHTFLPIELAKNGEGPRSLIDGTITAFPANRAVCAKCHTPGSTHDLSLDGKDDLNTLKTEYKDRLGELETLLKTKHGIVYDPENYPYFWPVAVIDHLNRDYGYGSPGNPKAVPPVPLQPAWPNKGVLGAAYNLNVLFRDPGGYVHNHRYTARLIYDSLDFLDDGLLNESYVSAAFPVTPPSTTGRPF